MLNDAQYPVFSASEYQRRYTMAKNLMQEMELDVLLFYGRGSMPDIHYLTNWLVTTEAYLIFPSAGKPTLLVQLSNHLPDAKRMAIIDDVRFGGTNASGGVDSTGTVISCLKERALERGRLGTVGSIPYQHYLRYKEALPEITWVDVSAQVRNFRQIKSVEELERIKRAAELSDSAVAALAQQLRPGLREYQLAQIVEDAYLGVGGYNGIHYMLSTSMRTPRAGVPSQHLSNRLIEKGDVLITEISAGWWGYSGQLHRTFTVGEGPTPEYARMHEVALETFERVEGILRDGATVEEVLDAAELIQQRGFTVYDDFLHGLNQLPPILRTRQTSRGIPKNFLFKEDMVVVIQPNVVTADAQCGLQFGEALRITKTGVERLHHYPRQLIICA